MLSRIIRRGFSLIRRYEDVHERRNTEVGPQAQYSYRFNEDPTGTKPIDLQNLKSEQVKDTPDFSNIACLQHNLSQYLDARIHEGDNNIGEIPSVSAQFISQLSDYKKPSEDQALIDIAERENCKFISSTSNISSLLIHMYYIFSNFRRPCMDNVFEDILEPKIHMISFRKPHTFILKNCKNKYVIESDPGFSIQSNQVLLNGGILIEYLLTTPKSQIEQEVKTGKVQKRPQYYRYNKTNQDLLLRSQIDCRHKDAKGKQFVFEIKSRALCPIRYDVENYKIYLDYDLKTKLGQHYSYERQYYDLIRGGMLKYAFQLIIGNMQGAFIAFHNTRKIFGYEYIDIKQVSLRYFGNHFNMNLCYLITCKMWTQILNVIINQFKQINQDNLKIGLYANSVKRNLMVLVQILSQTKKYEKVEMLDQVYGIENYYQKINGLKNKVYKLQFDFFLYKNGILLKSSQIMFTPTDEINLEWKWRNYGRLSPKQYFAFLHEAYKLQQQFGSFRFNGNWARAYEND